MWEQNKLLFGFNGKKSYMFSLDPETQENQQIIFVSDKGINTKILQRTKVTWTVSIPTGMDLVQIWVTLGSNKKEQTYYQAFHSDYLPVQPVSLLEPMPIISDPVQPVISNTEKDGFQSWTGSFTMPANDVTLRIEYVW